MTPAMADSGSSFDLGALGLTIRECASCNEPVSGAIASDGATSLVCGYCGREDTISIVRPRGDGEAVTGYRGKAEGARGRGKALVLDLGRPHPRFSGRPTEEPIRAGWLAAKGTAPGDDRADHDYWLVWLATGTSAWAMRRKENVRARAVLETALDLVETPAYRALVLARLARLAATTKAPALARAWLAMAPSSRAPEVTTDLRVAEAFVAREEGGPRALLDTLGAADSDAFTGQVRLLAFALRTDAHEKLGERALALATWTAGARAGGATMGSFAATYDLAPETRRRALRRGGVAIVLLLAAVWALFSVLKAAFAHDPVPLLPAAVVVVALFVAIVMKVQRGR